MSNIKKVENQNFAPEESIDCFDLSSDDEDSQLPNEYSFRVQNANLSFKCNDQSLLSSFEENNKDELMPYQSEGNSSEKRKNRWTEDTVRLLFIVNNVG